MYKVYKVFRVYRAYKAGRAFKVYKVFRVYKALVQYGKVIGILHTHIAKMMWCSIMVVHILDFKQALIKFRYIVMVLAKVKTHIQHQEHTLGLLQVALP